MIEIDAIIDQGIQSVLQHAHREDLVERLYERYRDLQAETITTVESSPSAFMDIDLDSLKESVLATKDLAAEKSLDDFLTDTVNENESLKAEVKHWKRACAGNNARLTRQILQTNSALQASEQRYRILREILEQEAAKQDKILQELQAQQRRVPIICFVAWVVGSVIIYFI